MAKRELEASDYRAYRRTALIGFIDQNRLRWRVPSNTASATFLRHLMRKSPLQRTPLIRTNVGPRHLYIWSDATQYEVALCLRPGSYLSHSTAAFLLGLSSAEPEYVYANQEQRVKESPRSELTQEAIDTAFERAQRESKQILTYKWWRIRLLNGRQTGQLGVVEIKGPSNERLLVTSTERH